VSIAAMLDHAVVDMQDQSVTNYVIHFSAT